jgi:two-component system repressor protein LuxO
VIRNVVVLHDGEQVAAAMLPAMLLRGQRPVGSPSARDAPPPPAIALPAFDPPALDPPPGVATAPDRVPDDPPPAPDAIPPTAAPAEPAEPEIIPLAVMERRLIEAALARTGNDVPRAAALLQINASTIYRKLQAWRAGG